MENELWTYYCIGTRPHPSLQAAALTKCVIMNGDVLALLEHCYQTIDRYDKEEILPLASLKARWLALAQQASRNARHFAPLIRQCVLCDTSLQLALWPEALRSLFFVHKALQFWPILSLVVRTFSLSAQRCRTFIATGRIQDVYPCPHVMTQTI